MEKRRDPKTELHETLLNIAAHAVIAKLHVLRFERRSLFLEDTAGHLSPPTLDGRQGLCGLNISYDRDHDVFGTVGLLHKGRQILMSQITQNVIRSDAPATYAMMVKGAGIHRLQK